MTDTVKPPPPPAPPSGAVRLLSGGEANARVLTATGDLQNTAQPQQLVGEVLGQDADGTVNIRTPSGDISVKINDRRIDPRPGDTVEIEIPPGNPPRTARISEPPEGQPTEPQTEIREEKRPISTPVEIQIDSPPAAETPATGQATPEETVPTRPCADIPVRLEPLTPEQALKRIQQIIQEFKTTINIPPQTTVIQTAVTTPLTPTQIAAPLTPDTLIQTSATVNIAPAPQAPFSPPVSTPSALPDTALPNILTDTTQITPPLFTPSVTITAPEPPPLSPLNNQTLLQPEPLAQAASGIIIESPKNILIKTFFSKPQTIETTPPPLLPEAPLPTLAALSGIDIPKLLAEGLSILPTAPAPSLAAPVFNQTNYAVIKPAAETAGTILLSPAAPTTDTPPIKESLASFMLEKTNTMRPETGNPVTILKGQQAGTQPAIIIGTTPQHLPIIALWPSSNAAEPEFLLAHMPAPGLSAGADISMIPAAAPTSSPMNFIPLPPAATLPLPFSFTAEPWPAMTEIYEALQQIAPQTARAMLAVTPSPANPANLGAAAMFFIAAVRGGDLTQWLGDKAVDALKRGGKSGLLTRLTQDGSALSKSANETTAQDWKQTILPMAWDQQIHKIALHHRSEGGEKNENSGGKQTRFIFDLNFNRLGPVQIDGLFRDQRLDLIVRTQSILSSPMQNKMKTLYTEAITNSNLKGEIGFQHHPEQWVTFTKPTHMMGVSV